ncbi:MAG: GNAT family N-acetyltransferase [Acidimicrobiales bacterium]
MRFDPTVDDEVRKAVQTGLRAYNDASSPILRGYRERGEDKEVPFDLYAFDDAGELTGGIVASTWGGWLAIDLVWVREDQRGTGLGSDLLRRIEQRARDERGCVGVRLDTWGFQAKPFYEKQGYTVFGVLEDYPPGETEYLLAKRLDGDAPQPER